jgi:hypothetical protein
MQCPDQKNPNKQKQHTPFFSQSLKTAKKMRLPWLGPLTNKQILKNLFKNFCNKMLQFTQVPQPHCAP